MTALKTLVTLIIVSIIGLAVLTGPLTGDGGKQAPGPQLPPAGATPANGPTAFVVLLAMIGVPLLGIAKRFAGD